MAPPAKEPISIMGLQASRQRLAVRARRHDLVWRGGLARHPLHGPFPLSSHVPYRRPPAAHRGCLCSKIREELSSSLPEEYPHDASLHLPRDTQAAAAALRRRSEARHIYRVAFLFLPALLCISLLALRAQIALLAPSVSLFPPDPGFHQQLSLPPAFGILAQS